MSDHDKPINQRDIVVAWHTLPTSVMWSVRWWGLDVPADEADAFLGSWQVAAHMHGVRDEYIPAMWAAGDAQAPEIPDRSWARRPRASISPTCCSTSPWRPIAAPPRVRCLSR